MTDRAEGSPSLRETHLQATRNRILDALAELLNECHPASISVPDVARRAGVGVATVYRHFPKKMDLFDSYALRNAEDAPELSDDVSGGDRLRAIASNFAKRESYYRIERFGPTIDEIRDRRRQLNFQQWNDALDEYRPDLSPAERDRICRTVTGLFTPWTYISLRDEGALSPDEAVEALVTAVEAVFWAGATREEGS